MSRFQKTTRDSNESEIIDALRKAGAHVVQLDQPVDLLVGFGGKTHLVEVKAPGASTGSNHLSAADVAPDGEYAGMDKRLTRVQADFLRAWRGGSLAVVETAGEALMVIGVCPTCGVEALATSTRCGSCELARLYSDRGRPAKAAQPAPEAA